MRIALIAALTRDRIIGRDNAMPWHIPADMRYFREITTGLPIIMGRRNFESIGRPLPKRKNIILTTDRQYSAPGCVVTHTPEDALQLAGDAPEVMIIGGGEIYRLFLPRADRLYLTWIETAIEGDTYFPAFDSQHWQCIREWHQEAGQDTPYPLTFQILDRI